MNCIARTRCILYYILLIFDNPPNVVHRYSNYTFYAFGVFMQRIVNTLYFIVKTSFSLELEINVTTLNGSELGKQKIKKK